MDIIDVHNEVVDLATQMGGDVSAIDTSITALQTTTTNTTNAVNSLTATVATLTPIVNQNTTDIAAALANVGDLGALETHLKTNLVAAINELVNEFLAYSQIDDAASTGVTNKTWSVDKIIAQFTALRTELVGNVSGAWDTLSKITEELSNEDSAINQLLAAVGTKLDISKNLSDLADVVTARNNLGLGSVATLNTGVSVGQVPVIETGSKLPALDGSQLSNVAAAKLATAHTLSITGDVTGSGSFDGTANVSIAGILANTGVTAGSYGNNTAVPVVSVDAKGRVTSAAQTGIRAASLTQSGLTQLTNSVTSTDNSTAATPNSVKMAYDLATTANTTANGAIQSTQKGTASGVATLDSNTLIPTAQIPALDWSKIASGKPTTLNGYSITDAVNISQVGTASGVASLDASSKVPVAQIPNLPWSQINSGLPTTLAGYGITDAQPLDADLTALAAVSVAGLLTRTAAGTAAARTITAGTGVSVSNGNGVSGNPTVALATSGVTAGTYPKVTVDAYGRATAGAALAAADIPNLDWSKITTGKPTTLSAYGITDAVSSSLLGVASGVATLDGMGKVPAAQLPSYVDDVLEFANLAGFPATGETAKIYTALDTNKIYRWSGSTYIEVSPSPGSTDAVAEGTTNLYFTAARAKAAVTSVTGNAGTATKLATARTISVTGDITGSGSFDGSANLSLAATLANTGVSAGSYGDTVTVPVLTIDAKGRITGVTATAIRAGSTTQTGLTQLTDSTSSTSTTTAATPNAVKTAYDLATMANTTANGAIPTTQKGVASGVATLDASSLVPVAQIPNLDWNKIASGKPTTLNGYGITDAISSSLIGAANGVAGLDASGLLAVAKLPTVAAQTNKVQNWTKSQAGAITTLTYSATLTVDLSLSNNFAVTLAGNATLAAPTNVVPGQSGAIRVTQDATGSRTLAYNTIFKFSGGTAPVLTKTAGATDILTYYVLSATEIMVSVIPNVK